MAPVWPTYRMDAKANEKGTWHECFTGHGEILYPGHSEESIGESRYPTLTPEAAQSSPCVTSIASFLP